mmetsp:Transcript_76900/g.152533  ORF Transcript_76900/g.152533 Transcript_76900/m.152533 type:complete len:94 (-) Transcript_76900:243-524(-)
MRPSQLLMAAKRLNISQSRIDEALDDDNENALGNLVGVFLSDTAAHPMATAFETIISKLNATCTANTLALLMAHVVAQCKVAHPHDLRFRTLT